MTQDVKFETKRDESTNTAVYVLSFHVLYPCQTTKELCRQTKRNYCLQNTFLPKPYVNLLRYSCCLTIEEKSEFRDSVRYLRFFFLRIKKEKNTKERGEILAAWLVKFCFNQVRIHSENTFSNISLFPQIDGNCCLPQGITMSQFLYSVFLCFQTNRSTL